MKNYKVHLPAGVQDYVGEEAWLKDEVETKIKQVYRSYRYQLVETPMFEYIDVFAKQNNKHQQEDLYKWINKEGEIVALRSDMTRAIARVVATRKQVEPMPIKYMYKANNFRYPNSYQGKLHEFTQIGLEIIGEKSCRSDVEAVELAIKSLEEVGIEDFTLHIGSSELLDAILDELEIKDNSKEAIFQGIREKDAVSVKVELEKLGKDHKFAKTIVDLIQKSGRRELLDKVKKQVTSKRAMDAVKELEDVYEELQKLGYEKYILFNMSLLSYQSYYTGIMFQGFTDQIGEEIVVGGRYDRLLSEFGKDLPAVGMAMNVNLIVQKLIARANRGE